MEIASCVSLSVRYFSPITLEPISQFQPSSANSDKGLIHRWQRGERSLQGGLRGAKHQITTQKGELLPAEASVRSVPCFVSETSLLSQGFRSVWERERSRVDDEALIMSITYSVRNNSHYRRSSNIFSWLCFDVPG